MIVMMTKTITFWAQFHQLGAEQGETSKSLVVLLITNFFQINKNGLAFWSLRVAPSW